MTFITEGIKDAIMELLNAIIEFVKGILGKELEGEDFADLLK